MQIEMIFQTQLNMLGIFTFHYFQKQKPASSIIQAPLEIWSYVSWN